MDFLSFHGDQLAAQAKDKGIPQDVINLAFMSGDAVRYVIFEEWIASKGGSCTPYVMHTVVAHVTRCENRSMPRSEREKAIFESVDGFKKEMNNEKIWLEVKEAARNASLDRMVSKILVCTYASVSWLDYSFACFARIYSHLSLASASLLAPARGWYAM